MVDVQDILPPPPQVPRQFILWPGEPFFQTSLARRRVIVVIGLDETCALPPKGPAGIAFSLPPSEDDDQFHHLGLKEPEIFPLAGSRHVLELRNDSVELSHPPDGPPLPGFSPPAWGLFVAFCFM